MKTITAAAVLCCVGMAGLASRHESHATPTADSSVTPCQIEGCQCGCAEGGPCGCVERSQNEAVMAALADISGRLDSLENPPVVLPERTSEEIMSGLQDAYEESQASVTEAERDDPAEQVEDAVQSYVPTPAAPQTHDHSLDADAQPTPYEVIFKAIDLLNLENTETLVDFGCGPDARVLTHAFHDTGCRGVGIEIDPARAASARNLVREAGLSPWIEIVEGDAVTASVQGRVGFVYLWPETLEELRPKLQELDRFVSYAHAVPGLDMQRIDVPGYEPLWYWERSPAEVEVSYAERPYAVYNGRRYYSDYNPGCNCSMCQTIRAQLRSRENVEQIPTQSQTSGTPTQSYSAPRTTTSFSTSTQRQSTPSYGCSNCSGGNCGRPMRFFRRR